MTTLLPNPRFICTARPRCLVTTMPPKPPDEDETEATEPQPDFDDTQ